MTFLTSANDRDANSLYMLGLCSRNGYGLAKDSAAALFAFSVLRACIALRLPRS